MGDASKHPTQRSTSDASSGWREFWKKSNGKAPEAEGSSSPMDTSEKKKRSRLSRLLHGSGSSNASSDAGQSNDTNKDGVKKRRQQVYQAQKRHRNRKAEYVQTLEAELARLQHLDSLAHSEKNALAHQNKAMRELLASHSLDAQIGTMDLNPLPYNHEDQSRLGSLPLDVRYDAELGKERTFLDWSDSENTTVTSDASTVTHPVSPFKDTTPSKGDAWAAVDFILALEWPCQNHMYHHHIHPQGKPMFVAEEGLHGHALTGTAAVYACAVPPSGVSSSLPGEISGAQAQNTSHGPDEAKWQLPHSEIDKLVRMSENLPLDDEEITPAQAYSAVRGRVPNLQLIKPVLGTMKTVLAEHVSCKGFGSVMPTDLFCQHLERTLNGLFSSE